MSKEKKTIAERSKPVFETLEPRLLLNADLPGLEVMAPDFDHAAVTLVIDDADAIAGNDHQTAAAAKQQTHELIIIDANTPDYQTLVDDLTADTDRTRHFEVLLLDADEDGLTRISQVLAQYQGLDAIHLFSHGADGTLQLGSSILDLDAITKLSDAIAGWANAFSENGDLLIYGCNLAASDEGKSLLDALSRLTEADVAASDNLTGNATRGGDWDLEYQLGAIETDIAISLDTRLAWNGLLDIEAGLVGHWTVDADASDTSGNGNDGVLTGDASIDTNSDTNRVGPGKLALDGDGDYVELSGQASSFSSLTQGTIAGWINTSDTTNIQTIFGIADKGDAISYSTLGIYQGSLFFDVAENSTYSVQVVADQTIIADGNWHHVAVTVDGTGNSLYIDGTRVAIADLNYWDGNETTTDFFSTVTNVDAVEIGVTAGSNALTWDFNGLLDDIRVYDRALNAGEISQLYNFNKPPSDILLAQTTQLAIANAGFESQTLAEDAAVADTITGWSVNSADGTTGVWNPSTDWYPGEAPEGQNVAFIDVNSAEHTFFQVLTDTFEANRSYTLSAWVGDESNAGDSNGWEMRLYAGTQLLGKVTNADFDPTDGEFVKATLHLDADTLATYSAHYGEALKIEFSNIDTGGSANVHFDDVQLEYTYLNVEENAANGTIVGDVASVTDPDSGDTHTFSLVDDAGGRFAIDSNTGIITVANGSLLNYATNSSHGITIRATDQTGKSYDERFTIQVLQPLNEVPAAQNVDEDNTLVFSSANGNPISIHPGSLTGNQPQVTLSAANGTLTLSQTTGLTFSSGDGSADASMTFSGSAADINAALDGLSFTPDADFNGSASIQITTWEDDALVGAYTFDDTANPGADSGPGIANDGTVTGTTPVNDPTRGNVLQFTTGTTDGISIPGLYGQPASVTLSAWIDFTGTDPGEIISLADGIALRAGDWGAGNDGLSGFIYDGVNWDNSLFTTDAVANTGWRHVAFTFDDVTREMNLYLDGRQVATSVATAAIDYSQFTDTSIGRHADPVETQFVFDGRIDDTRIYSRALTATEIAQIKNTAARMQSDTIAITVNAVNDAPENVTASLFPHIAEDDVNSPGKLVSDFTTSTTDVDAGALFGIAVTAADNTNGTWQYTLDGATWQDMGTVSATSARLLDAGPNTRVRFVPNADYNGTVFPFSYVAWDQTIGTSGGLADTSVRGGTTAFSTASASVSVVVDPVNDAPVIATNTGATVAEGSTGNVITTAMLNEGDVDDSGAGLTYTVTSDVANGTLKVNGTVIGAGGTFTQADIDAGLVTYDHDGSQTASDSFAFTLADGGEDGAGTAAGTFTFSITNVNDAPVLSGIETTPLAYTENDPATIVSAAITVGDVDDTHIDSAVVRITGNYQNGEDLLAFADTGTITGAWDAATGTLTLSGADTLANYQAALQSITYVNGSDSPSTLTRTVSFTVNDGNLDSNTLTRDISITAINDAPLLDNTGDMTLTAISEDDINNTGNTVAEIIASAGGDRITDYDSGALEGIAVTGADNSNGTWQYSTDGGTAWSAFGPVAGTSAVLLDTTAMIRFVPNADYAGSAGTITFRAWDRTSGSSGDTGVDVSVNGGDTAFSATTETATLTVNAVNDAPVNTVPASIAVTEDVATPLTGIAIADVDAAASPVQMTLSVPVGTLAAASGGGVTVGGTASDLTLTGTVGDINSFIAAGNVAYTTAPDANGSLTLTVTTSDQGNSGSGGTLTDSDTVTLNITAVDDAPTATNLDAAETYIEDTPLNLTDIVVSDVDSDVTVTLTLSDTAAGSLNTATSGAVTSTFAGGVWSASGAVADVNTLLSGLTFTPAPDYNADFSIATSVSDGVNPVLSGTKNMTGTAVNDAPAFANLDDTPTFSENGAAVILDADVSVSDAELDLLNSGAGNYSGAIIDLKRNGGAAAEDSFSFIDGNGITLVGNSLIKNGQVIADFDTNTTPGQLLITFTDTNGEIPTTADVNAILRQIAYSNTNDTPPGSVQIAWDLVDANDGSQGMGGVLIGSGMTTVNISATNDAPVVIAPGMPLAATEQTAMDIQGVSFSVSDADESGSGALATLSVGEGTLTVSAGDSGVTVTAGNGTGTVSLSGTILQLNALLTGASTGTITYLNSSDSPSASTTLSITVNDQGNTGTDPGLSGDATSEEGTNSVTINITPVNDEQSLDINTGLGLNEGATATIDNTRLSSSDPDNTAAQLLYTVTSSPVNGQLELTSAPGVAINSFTQDDIDNNRLVYVHDGSETTTDSFDFSVDDGAGASTAGTFNISIALVNENAPVITAAQSFTVSESAVNGASLGNAVATDVDTGTTLQSWTITAGNTDGIFAIDANTGEITVTDNTNLDFDTTPSYALSLTVSDGTHTSAVETVTINITDVSTAITAGQSFTVSESAPNGTAVGTVATTGDTPASFTITGGNTGSAFAIDNSGHITVADASAIDYETLTSYSLTIEASDGTTPVSETVTIAVTDVNESAVGAISDVDASADIVAEDAVVGSAVGITAFADDPDGTDTVTYSLSDDAGGLFAINANTGVVTVANPLDYETSAWHSITVLATSSDTSISSRAFTIGVSDVNEAPVGPVSDTDAAANTVAEDAMAGTAVGITAFADDPDGTDTVTYSLSDDAGGLFSIDANSGVVTVSGVLDAETSISHDITVLATSTDGSTSTQLYSITVTDADEFDTTAISDADASANTVDENAAIGTPVGITAFADDSDITDSISYSLDMDAGGAFTIDGISGVVTVAGALDAETATSYDITVRATSTDGSFSTQTYSIGVNDLNDNAPAVVPGQSFDLAEDAAPGTSVGVVAATDADTVGTLQGWSIISGNEDGVFAIDAVTGEITVADPTPLDFETTSNYSLAVQVSDGMHASAVESVEIHITDVNETPTTTGISDISVSEDAPDTHINLFDAFADAEHPDSALTYTIVQNTHPALFQSTLIDGSTGTLTLAYAAHQNGAAEITVRATDPLGLWTETTFSVSVGAVNDAPIGSVPDAQSTLQDTVLVFSHSTGNAISITDVDAFDAEVQVDLSTSRGSLTLATTQDLIFITGDGHQDTQMIFRGTVAAVNAALDGLRFEPLAGWSGPAALQITVDDLGNSGSGGPLADTRSVVISVLKTSVETPPGGSPDGGVDPTMPPPLDTLIPDLGVAEDHEDPTPVDTEETASDTHPASTVPDQGNDGNQQAQEPVLMFATVDLQNEHTQRTLAKLVNPGPFSIAQVHRGMVEALKFIATDGQQLIEHALWHQLDEIGQQMSENEEQQTFNLDSMAFKTAAGVTFTLSAGYVSWLVTSGSLATSMLSLAPLWMHIDPIPVIGAIGAKTRTNNSRQEPDTNAERGSGEGTVEKLFESNSSVDPKA